MYKMDMTQRLVLLLAILLGACAMDAAPATDPVNPRDVTYLLPVFAATPSGWLAPYPGEDGDRVLELRAAVRCRAPSKAIMLCARETDVQADLNHATLEECTWAPCVVGDVIELVTPTSFLQGERSQASILVTSTTSAIGDYVVLIADVKAQPL